MTVIAIPTPYMEASVKLPKPIRLDARTPIFGRPRAKDVAAVYRERQTIHTVSRLIRQRGGKEAWQMILDAIDAGFATPSTGCIKHPTMRLLFTDARPQRGAEAHESFFNRYLLSDPRHREYIRTTIWPVALANKEAVLADPRCLEGLVAGRPNSSVVVLVKPAHAPTVPSGEYPMTMYGMPIWPRPTWASYSYEQARAACWFFMDLLHLCEQSTALNTPQAKAMGIRFSTRAIQRFADKDILALTDAIATAMVTRPDDPCEPPPKPVDNRW
jgi:hypothetical protein